MKRLIRAVLIGMFAVAACDTPQQEHAPSGPFSAAVQQASHSYQVPEKLLLAISWNETRFQTGSDPSLDRGFGPMHLREGLLLERAARLSGQSEQAVHTNPAANLLAGAAMLRDLRDARLKDGSVDAQDSDLVSWYRELVSYAEANGAKTEAAQIAFADGVFAILPTGAEATVSGERIVLEPEDVLPPGTKDTGTLSRALGGDYSNAQWIASPNWDSRAGTRIDTIVIHDTEGSYSSAISWFQTGQSQVSAHYIVRSSDGAITQMVSESNRAWHVNCWNSRAIGIEHEGFRNQTGWYTEAMYQASAKLVQYLTTKWGIPRDRAHIKGHEELNDCNSHSDPGPNWNWAHFMSLVGGSSRGGGSTTGGSACSVHADGKLYCPNTIGAALYSSPRATSALVNHLRTASSWFDCWATGDLHSGGNTTWYHTLGDDNTNWGWVAASNMGTTSAFDGNPSGAGLRRCQPAAPVSSACSVQSDGKLHCTNVLGASLYSAPAPSSAIVNHLRTNTSWFDCWGLGAMHAGGNTTWYHTIGDDNANWGWVPAVSLNTASAFDANPGAAGLRRCY